MANIVSSECRVEGEQKRFEAASSIHNIEMLSGEYRIRTQ